jgi:hypothetical protein
MFVQVIDSLFKPTKMLRDFVTRMTPDKHLPTSAEKREAVEAQDRRHEEALRKKDAFLATRAEEAKRCVIHRSCNCVLQKT